MECKYTRYDQIYNTFFINLFTLGKEDKTLAFEKVNTKDEKHLLILEISKQLNFCLGYQVQANIPFYKKIFHKNLRKIKKLKKKDNLLNIDEIISFTTKGLEVNDNILLEIYKSYFKGE